MDVAKNGRRHGYWRLKISLNQQQLLNNALLDVELPEGLMFAHPEDPPGHQDMDALNEFLREFEKNHESLEVVGLFSVDQDE